MENKTDQKKIKQLNKKILQMKNALKISEEKYKNLLERSSDIIFVHQNYKVILASNACAKLLGFKQTKELIGKHLLKDIVHPDYRNIVKKRVQKIVKEGKEVGFLQEKIKKQNGEYIDIDVCAVPFFYKGKPAVKVYARDITHIKKLQKEIEKRNINLQNYTNYIQKLIEDEKLKLSHELHDELGQLLSILKLEIIKINKKITDDNKDLTEKVNNVLNLLEIIMNRLKIISYQLRPPILDHLGLEAAINWQIDEFQKVTNIKCIKKINFNVNKRNINENTSIILFRILQEALTNILRHAYANEVKIHIYQNKKFLILKIKDNGIGIKEEQINNPKSLGIISIKERILTLDGKFFISGKENKGTILKIEIPLKKVYEN